MRFKVVRFLSSSEASGKGIYDIMYKQVSCCFTSKVLKARNIWFCWLWAIQGDWRQGGQPTDYNKGGGGKTGKPNPLAPTPKDHKIEYLNSLASRDVYKNSRAWKQEATLWACMLIWFIWGGVGMVTAPSVSSWVDNICSHCIHGC